MDAPRPKKQAVIKKILSFKQLQQKLPRTSIAYWLQTATTKLLAICMLVTIVCAIGVYMLLRTANKPPLYIAEPTDGAPYAMVPLPLSIMADHTLLSWASQAVARIYSFNFNDYYDHVAAMRPYFSSGGYNGYLLALSVSGIGSDVLTKKLVVATAVCDAPTIIKKSIDTIDGNRTFIWKVQLPVIVQYQSASERETRVSLIELIIQRVMDRDNPLGIAISGFHLASIGFEQRDLCSG